MQQKQMLSLSVLNTDQVLGLAKVLRQPGKTPCEFCTANLVFAPTNSNAEVTVNQRPSKSVSPGKNLQIPCTMSGASLGSAPASWYWQVSGNTPLLVYYYSGSIYRASGIPDRSSLSVSGNIATFTISNVQSEDAADYYCATKGRTYKKGKEDVSNPRAPAVSVLPPSANEIAAKGTATLVWLVNGFNPGPVDIEWTVDGSETRNGVETSPIQQNMENTFSASGYLTLPALYWNSHELYSCMVEHESQANPLQSSIARSSCI
ncbi:LOW QUALITY PROTEIN: immunoglobulin lambda-1 light chain-like [Pristis pectinata]|uniref:LOW QUALITY PROTEIN: immunoglobulin lambda-1 light chain-like n=1 Tax=Pristis pectinata TaxID=685728 RepID=UPI00223E29B5|nr:LOW QUALITY PROTEIN: immunoglobulin lambda-1 light chain-like [Pristis pectinata]